MARLNPRTSGLPQVIAHRGASGHRPEHTLVAYERAFRLGADSVEIDLVATRDGVLVCRHDVELSRTTDVADRPAFAHLRRTLDVEGQQVVGWFVHDFTAVELRELRARERWPRKRPYSAAYDGHWAIPTLAEVLAVRDREAARAGRSLGLHLELKSPQHLRGQGLWLPELAADVRDRDLTWMSFDAEALRSLGATRSVRLYERTPSPRELSRAARYAVGIGVRRRAVLPPDLAGRVAEPSKLVARAHRRGLDVLVWTHRAENQHLPANLRIGAAPHAHGDAVGEAAMLFEAGIDGLISDFPEIGIVGRNRVPGLSTGSTSVG